MKITISKILNKTDLAESGSHGGLVVTKTAQKMLLDFFESAGQEHNFIDKDDDIVLVEITSKMTLDRLEGRVLKIIKRQVERYIGEITFDKKGKGHITLDDSKIKLNIEIPKDKSLNAVDGHKVVVELGRRINKNTKYEGKVVEIIGHKNDPGVDILSIIYKYNINVDFPEPEGPITTTTSPCVICSSIPARTLKSPKVL